MDAERWQRLSPLLDELLELPPQERPARLEALREGDATLAAELQRLLALEEGETVFLSRPALVPPPGVQPGRRIGPYRLDRLLGEGGMGQVWLAHRDDGLYERQVALKLLRPGLADTRLHQRFDREREILARLAHPNIARLFDAGFDHDGQPFLALEYVDGEPITDYARSRQLGIPARLDLFRQVCDAVSHAHANLIVHRDLKPSNILVAASGQVRLLDFGIAKLLDAERSAPEQTRTGVRAFTLHYAAPEQIRGEPVSTMTDVYSLGVVLYELLTGGKPYRLKRQTDAEWEEAILAGETLRPSSAAAHASAAQTAPYAPARLSRLLAGDLDNIVLKAMAKLPEQRYASSAALAQDLQSYLRGRPVSARGESVGYRLRKYVQRHRWAIGSVAVVMAMLFAALGMVSWQARQATREAGRAQAMQEFVADLFESAGNAPTDAPMNLRDLLAISVARGDLSLARQPQARAELYGVVARLRLELGDYAEADALLLRQAALLSQLPAAPASLRLEAATLRGKARRQLNDAAGCVAWMRPLQDLARLERRQLPAQAGAFYSQLGRCHRALGEYAMASRLYDEALLLRREAGDEVGIAESMLDLAGSRVDDGQPRQAIASLRKALERLVERVGERHPLAVDMLRSLCSMERSAGNQAAAERDCRSAVALAGELHGRDHRAAVDARRQLAALFVDAGRFQEAETEFLAAWAWMRTRLDPNHADMARLYNSLAIVAWERGYLDTARDFQQRAVTAQRASGIPGPLADALFNQAMILHDGGEDAAALPAARESLQLRTERYGPAHELVGDGQRLLGEVLAALGQADEARAALSRAVELTRAGYGPSHSHARRAEISLLRFNARQGDAEAVARLDALGRGEGDLEQRKASWLARAYAAETRCTAQPRREAAELEAILSQMQLVLPEGGALTREVGRIRAACGTRRLVARAGGA